MRMAWAPTAALLLACSAGGCGDGDGGATGESDTGNGQEVSVPSWVDDTRARLSGSGELADTPEVVEFEGVSLYVFDSEDALGPVVVTEDCEAADRAAQAGAIDSTVCFQRDAEQFTLIG